MSSAPKSCNKRKVYNDGNVANSVPIVVPANNSMDIWVGVGNQLTIVGGNGTTIEMGTASSGNAGVMD